MTTRRDFFLSAAFAAAANAQPANPPRKLRRDSFFGLHFDLHPNPSDTALGRDLTHEMAARLLDRVKPDYIQYDCKGHPGYLGYPSKTGHSAPGIVKDSLEIWRAETARRGVGLYIHFSGVWDSLAVERHPEWARVRPDGKPEPNQTSTFGPYVDALMIPELEEASEKYDLDGVWVDGECWATGPDYSATVEKQFGSPLPKGPKDPRWLEFLDFNREQFRRYVRHYLDVLHRTRPKFQIASNWLYSTLVPERPVLPVDFVSGDYLGNAPIATARLEARYMASIDKPWDLMAWGFQSGQNHPVGHIHKPPAQLQQEASVVLAQGGGFQVYFVPTRASYFDDRLVSVMEQTAGFCRARQSFCHKSETVPQIGLLFSRHSLYQTSDKLFGSWPGRLTAPARGMLDALIEAHLPVDVIPDWKIAEVGKQYPLLVVPEWLDIGAETKEQLLATRSALLVCGAENAKLFEKELGVTLLGEAKDREAYVLGKDLFANARGRWQDVNPGSAEVLERVWPTIDFRGEGAPAATRRGKIAAIYGNIGSVFAAAHAPATREFIARVVRKLFEPMVEVTGPPTLEVVLRRKNGKLYVHLLNATNMQVAGDYAAVDFVPPVGPVRVRVKAPQKGVVVWKPTKMPPLWMSSMWKDGWWNIPVPRVEIHGAIEIG